MSGDTETKPRPTLDDEICAVSLMHGAAMAAFMTEKNERFTEMTVRLIPFVKALLKVGIAHRAELEAAWAKAKSEPGPFGLRFDQEEG
jgi:hypothetical protein